MNSLVKVPPYSKLNFQGKIFFTQNWCNITLRMNIHTLLYIYLILCILFILVLWICSVHGLVFLRIWL